MLNSHVCDTYARSSFASYPSGDGEHEIPARLAISVTQQASSCPSARDLAPPARATLIVQTGDAPRDARARRSADRVAVLLNGRVVELGPPVELASAGGWFEANFFPRANESAGSGQHERVDGA